MKTKAPPRYNTGIPGKPQKFTSDLKQMILGALEAVGGQSYLEDRALDQPVAFMALLAKILPMQQNLTLKRDVNDYTNAELAAIIAAGSEDAAEPAPGSGEPRSVH